MKVCGIAAEYNPFHYGHKHHIEEARKQSGCDIIAAVMSGNFVQRGEPAVIDKWTRSKAAVEGGADLVLELPFFNSCQNATAFARGAVEILKDIGADTMAFGSECGNLENLMDIASTPADPNRLHELMRSGMSYPRAYSILTSSMYPNDILAIAYLKELETTSIRPIVIPRIGDYSSTDTDVEYASAAAIRTALKKQQDITSLTPMASQLLAGPTVTMEDLYPYFRTLILTLPRSYTASLFLVSEGIEKTMKDAAMTSETLDAFLKQTVSYRYTAARIRRIMVQIMMHVTPEEVHRYSRSHTVRVLAFNERGRQYLHEKKKDGSCSFAVRFAAMPEQMRQIEYRAALLYTSQMKETDRQALLKKEISGAQYV
ncbi:MAG: nucleotidyltransferase family protein [Solobacterium sp.]|nr:nucleotidyltransferase family protein [Solobacterium sp.]